MIVVLLVFLLALLLLRRRGKTEESAAPVEEARKPRKAKKAEAESKAIEGFAAEIEQRLAATFERLRLEEKRLDERQATLAAGESEFDRTAEERIGRLTEWEHALAARDAALAQREAGIEEAFTARELELAQKAADVASRESALARRAAETEARERQPAPVASPELEGRERAVEARLAAVSQRELELARRAAELAVREPEQPPTPAAPPGSQVVADPPPLATFVPLPEPVEAVPAPLPPPPASEGRWNVLALDRLVEQRGHEFPDRVEEWTSYLYSLRAYATPDGSLPANFDPLIQETFGELV